MTDMMNITCGSAMAVGGLLGLGLLGSLVVLAWVAIGRQRQAPGSS
jgi:hypothetical protein